MTDIRVSYEAKRGCGFRKEGIYLIGGKPDSPCGKLPIPLDVCPVCGCGIKVARGWTWVKSDLIKGKLDGVCLAKNCPSCPLHDPSHLPFEKAGLLWVGEKFYRGPKEFMAEANKMGISRRLNQLPHHFKIGETWVLLAHRFAFGEKGKGSAGIFTIFKPLRIEQVVKGTEPEEEITRIRERGFEPVIVKRIEDEPEEDEGL